MGTINMVLGIILIVITLLLVLLAGLAILIMSLSGEPILGMSIFMICTVRICVGIAVANIMISYEVITFTGRQITVKRIGKTRTYDCSEIKKIACGVFTTKNGGLSYVSLIFNDGKGYVYDWYIFVCEETTTIAMFVMAA